MQAVKPNTRLQLAPYFPTCFVAFPTPRPHQYQSARPVRARGRENRRHKLVRQTTQQEKEEEKKATGIRKRQDHPEICPPQDLSPKRHHRPTQCASQADRTQRDGEGRISRAEPGSPTSSCPNSEGVNHHRLVIIKKSPTRKEKKTKIAKKKNQNPPLSMNPHLLQHQIHHKPNQHPKP